MTRLSPNSVPTDPGQTFFFVAHCVIPRSSWLQATICAHTEVSSEQVRQAWCGGRHLREVTSDGPEGKVGNGSVLGAIPVNNLWINHERMQGVEMGSLTTVAVCARQPLQYTDLKGPQATWDWQRSFSIFCCCSTRHPHRGLVKSTSYSRTV